ncbi:MAG: putative molybdenum carrier protein [Verrucomicrobiota bacterium]
MPLIEKIVSGGQTGADRAALDWAIEKGIKHALKRGRPRTPVPPNGRFRNIPVCQAQTSMV